MKPGPARATVPAMEAAALVAVGLLGLLEGFQLALALGAPLGAVAWGGRHPGALPPRLRVASAVAALVYPVVILLVLASAGLVTAGWLPGAGPGAMWALTGFFALGTVMNSISRSRPERLWGPIALALAVCCGIVAAGAA